MSIHSKLPYAENSLVESAKVTGYLLSATHETGKVKVKFFTAFGFSVDDGEKMKIALRQHGLERPVVNVTENVHGVKYELECFIETPDARNPCITTVWIVEAGDTSPRLVTAYPSKSIKSHN